MPDPVASEFRNWGPYLSFGTDSSREVVVSWESASESSDSWLRWGVTLGDLAEVERATGEPTCHHSFRLDGLEPSTRYFYQISRDGGATTYNFRTGPALGSTEAFEFAVLGDIHSTHRDVRPGYKAIDRYAPGTAFVVTVGDSINDGLQEADWRDFFYQTTPFMSDRPWMNATGNHDTGNPEKYRKFLRAWDHPFHDPELGGFYSFQYGNAHFILLDSNNAGGWSPTPSDEQFEWLESELERKARGNSWVFVFLHHQIYSTADFSCSRAMHLYLRPVFDEYHVDAVFYGHDHSFEAFHCGRDEPWGGTHYVVTGGGGSNLDWSIMDPRKKRRGRVTGPHYLWLSDTHVASREFYDGGDVDNKYGARNDALVRECQLFGTLRHHFTHLAVRDDVALLRAVGWDGTVYFERELRRTSKPA
ncbi:MAG: metallophosphoesterase [Promethearchaeota archaeon]